MFVDNTQLLVLSDKFCNVGASMDQRRCLTNYRYALVDNVSWQRWLLPTLNLGEYSPEMLLVACDRDSRMADYGIGGQEYVLQ